MDLGDAADGKAIHAMLAAARMTTLERIGRLAGDVKDLIASAVDTNADDEHDPEGATIAYERAQLAALLVQARAELSDLEAAEARLAAGGYGLCERCAAPIPALRLAARPAAGTCVRCAGQLSVRHGRGRALQ